MAQEPYRPRKSYRCTAAQMMAVDQAAAMMVDQPVGQTMTELNQVAPMDVVSEIATPTGHIT